MKSYSKLIGAMVISCLLAACATTNPPPTPMTSLEIQTIQKRTFETNKKVAFASTMSVFQDLGYTINSASFETGFITATSPTQGGDLFTAQLLGTPVSSNQVKATAFVEEIKENQSTVRLNFVESMSWSAQNGQTSTKDRAILDTTIYQNAFTKIQEAIFIRSSI
jgi:hypothetical protein